MAQAATTASKTTKRSKPGTTHNVKVPKQPASRAGGNYVTNSELLEEVRKSKQAGKMSDRLAFLLMLLVRRYASKGSWVNYTYNDEMQSYALVALMRTWKGFDETRFTNAFAYYTQCVKSSFIQYLKSEKAHQRLRDALMVDGGMMPSYAYQMEHSSRGGSDDYHSPDEEVTDIPEYKHTSSGGRPTGPAGIQVKFDAHHDDEVDQFDEVVDGESSDEVDSSNRFGADDELAADDSWDEDDTV